jgi:pimeloyl-ACP methyl ester carboxylesterase
MSPAEPRTMTLHGHSVRYVQEGSGPVLLLIHGMAGALDTWRSVIEPLSRHATVLAVDLPGHGASSPGGGDYSLGSHAAFLRDVLTALGHDQVTLVGHSLGGGIAMQFSYQFPQMTERLVLVSSGGLGLEVSPALRAASLPGADLFVSLTAGAAQRASGLAGQLLRIGKVTPKPAVQEIARSYAALADADHRAAFLATVRSVVGLGGQTVRAGDRLHLAQGTPVLLVWGQNDPIIPVAHAQMAYELLPESTLEVFDGVGHFPQLEAPQQFVEALENFCAGTQPAVFDAASWQVRMRAGG